MLTLFTAPQLEVRPAALRSIARQPIDADNRSLAAIKTDAIPLHLQLRGAIRIHVVAELIGRQRRCCEAEGREVETVSAATRDRSRLTIDLYFERSSGLFLAR